jgi:riboflavin kinase/FMN adenylyltransferase
MQHYRSLEAVHLNDAWVTIGSFDGIHRGHQEIIRSLTAGAHSLGCPAVVLTFFPHPDQVLRGRKDAIYLTSPEEQAELLGQLGVDVLVTHPFNPQVASMTAVEFMTRLEEHLGLSHLWVGYDFALGRGRQGTVAVLRELGQDLGYTLDQFHPIVLDGQVISSSRVRAALTQGDVEQAAQLLGRHYSVSGVVAHGDGRGRPLGIPTANLEVWGERALPQAGVYVCRALVGGHSWGSVTNIGVRPTFESQPVPPRVEAHLLDFDHNADLYDQEVRLSFIARLREERRFPSVQALLEQIQQDISDARIRLQ